MTELLAALLLGVAGSLHCVAMCGPLLIAVRPTRADVIAPWQAIALHHGGRLAIYAALGALAGFAGQGMTLVGWSRALAIASGAALLLLAWRRGRADAGGGERFAPRGARVSAIARLPGRLLSQAARHVRRHPRAGRLLLGALNGLLPCGMVYVALTAAVGLGRVSRAVAFMLLFGVGTMPALAIVSIGASRLSGAARAPRWRFAAPVAIALVGLLLIGRGLQSPASHASHGSHESHGSRLSGAPRGADAAPAPHHH